MTGGKLKVKTLLKWMFLLCCILNYQLFYFLRLPNELLRYNSANNKTLITLIIIGMFGIMLIIKRTDCMSKWLSRYLFFFFADVIAVYVYSVAKYRISLYSVFSVSYFYFILLLAPSLVYIFEREKGFEKTLDTVMYVTLAAMILLAIQSFLYNTAGVVFLDGYFQVSSGIMRSGFLRMSITPLGPFISIYAGYRAMSSQKHRWRYAMIALFGIYCAAFVSRTRMLIIITVVCNLIMYLMCMKKQTKTNKICICFAIAVIVVSMLPQLNTFFNTFSVDNVESGSNTSIRLEAIAYYMGYILKYPLTGQGFINAANSMELYVLLRGLGGHFYYDDIGMIGTASRFGVPGFVFQLLLLPFFWKTKNAIGDKKERILLIGLMSYYLLSMISLSMFDTQRILVLAITLAVFDYLNTLCKIEKEG